MLSAWCVALVCTLPARSFAQAEQNTQAPGDAPIEAPTAVEGAAPALVEGAALAPPSADATVPPTQVPPTPPVALAAPPPTKDAPPAQGEPASSAVAPLDPWLLTSKDRRFTLKIGAQLQFRYQASDADKKSDKQLFSMREVRPQIRASIGKPWITVFIQPELANVPQLLDLELTVQPTPAFGIKVGQFLTPFSRTFYTPVPKLLFPDFSLANNAFRADRDTGAMLFGTPFAGLFEYYVGVFNGNRINQNGNDDDKLLGIARLAVNPLGAVSYDETPGLAGKSPLRLALGLNGYYGRVPPTAATSPAFPLPTNSTPAVTSNAPVARDTTATVGADIALRFWLATLQGELYYRKLDKGVPGPDVKAKGGYVHAASFVYWPYVELSARVNWLDPSEAKRDHTLAYEGLANLYVFGNNLKLNLRYAYFDNPASASGQPKPAENQFTAQTQWYF